jgi:hypothetical protein
LDNICGTTNARLVLRSVAHAREGIWICVLFLLTAAGGQFAWGQNFAVRNPRHLNFPEAEANRIYQSAAEAIQKEFQQGELLRPQFTLVLGVDHNQMDVASSELRLVKWDRNLFAKGVVLFSFEQLMPEQRATRLMQRVVSEATAVITPEEVRTSQYAPQRKGAESPLHPLQKLEEQSHPVLHPN